MAWSSSAIAQSGSERDLPLGHVCEGLYPVGICPHGVGDEVVADAEIRRAMQEGPVDLGIVHLGDQVVGRELHVHHRGRHVLLEIVLAADRPLEAAELRGTEVGVLQRVEPSRHGLVQQAAVVRLSPVSRPPHRHEVRRDGELQMPLELLPVVESAVAAHVGEYVGVPVVDHGAWRGLPENGRGQYIPQGALDLATALTACRGPPGGRFVPLPSAPVYTTGYHDRTGAYEAVH